MAKAKLGNPFIAEISSGQAAPQNQTAFSTKGIPFIRAGSLEFLCSGGDEEGLERVTDKAAKEYKLRLFPADTIVFAKSGMSAKIPRIYRLKDKCYLVSHLAAIIPCLSNVYPNYLEHYLKYNHPCSLISNDSYPSIRLSEIEEFEVILPSLDEQKKISGVFDAVDKLIHNRQLQLSKLDQLVKARFIEMFGEPDKNTFDFEMASGKNLFKFSSGKFLSDEKRLQNGIPVYGGNGIAWYTDEALIDYPTLVIGRVGAYCGNVRRIDEPVWITDNAIYIKEFKTSNLTLEFLFYLMKFLNFSQFADFSGQPKITQKPLENTLYIIPPLPLQEEFAAFVQKVDKSKSAVKQSLEKLETLKKSLMQEYFG